MELKEHLESLNKDFNELKKYNDDKLSAIEERTMSKADLDERLDRITASMNVTEETMQKMQTQMNRPTLGPDDESSALDANKKEAFGKYLRKGMNYLTPPELKVLTEGVESEGGALAPSTFRDEIIRILTDTNAVRQLCRTLEGDHQTIDVPKRDSTTITATWTAEDTAIAAQDNVYSQVSIHAEKIASRVDVTGELLADARFDLESELATDFGLAFSTEEGKSVLLGSGSGEPQGIITDATVTVTTSTAGVTPAFFVADDLIDLMFQLRSGYQANATWMMKMSTLGSVRTLKGSDNNYLWQPGLSAGDPTMILGRPVVPCDSMAAGTATKAILVGDLSQYIIYDRSGLNIVRDDLTNAAKYVTSFICVRRTGGGVAVSEAFKVLTLA